MTTLQTGVRAAARCLALDLLAAQTADLLAAADIQSVLLKGPATVRQLYAAAPQDRSYSDVDLLVSPESFDAAERVLAAAGYRCRELGLRPGETAWYETAWFAPDADLTVDLHRGFHGVHDPGSFWAAMWASREYLELAGRQVAATDRTGTALLIVLHSVVPGGSAKPLRDLQAASDIFDAETWRAAVILANLAQAGSAFRAGIELLPGGDELAARLHLSEPVAADQWLAGRQRSAVSVNLAVALLGARGNRYLWRRMVPSAALLRLKDPRARSGTRGLLLAYLDRFGRVVRGAPRAVRDVREARRATRAR